MFEKADYVMIMVSDMKRSMAFYRDVLGLRVRFESPEWSELDTGATTIALHGGGKSGAKDHALAGTATIGFHVTDLDAIATQLRERGAHFVKEPEDRPGEPIRLAVIADPDGLEISIAQQVC